MKKGAKLIPYTISNFKKLITENHYYVDKTKYIAELEKVYIPVFLRPRRFGKTLFTEMLRYYYDLKYADEFQNIFGNLYIGKNPTPKHNTYYFLALNFSGMATWSEGDANFVKKQFDSHNQSSFYFFLLHYKEELNIDDDYIKDFSKNRTDASDALKAIITLVHAQKGKIYLVIDEYDSLTNAMSIYYQHAPEDDNEYLNILKKGGFFRGFFETIKYGTATSIDNVYITGILPITIADMNSGFNIATWLTFENKFANMLGFTEQEVKNFIDKIYQDYNLTPDKTETYNILKEYYDGYKFIFESKEYLFNPTMTLYFLSSLVNNNRYPDLMTDRNTKIDYRQIAYIFGNNTEKRDDTIKQITDNKQYSHYSTLNISFDMEAYKSGLYIPEGLFYSGILTHSQYQNEYKVPNITTYEMVLSYFKKINKFDYSNDLTEIVHNYYTKANVDELIDKFFTKVIQKFPGDFFKNANESFYHGLLFHILWNTTTRNIFEVLPEYNLPTGTIDIILHSFPGARVRHKLNDIFELKQVPKSAKEPEFNAQFEKVKKQAKKHLTGDYKNWRAVAVCFRGNKDYKIKIYN